MRNRRFSRQRLRRTNPPLYDKRDAISHSVLPRKDRYDAIAESHHHGLQHLGYEGQPDSAERMAEFYAARARGGAALIITGGCAINEEAIGGGNFSCIFRAEDLQTLRVITDRVHESGGRIGLQLFHAGRYASREWLNGVQPVAPSAIRSPLHPATPRAMTQADIERTLNDFAHAAALAKEAGCDCVEIMGSEGYLINQFFSPVTNKREDDWGGSKMNRARFGIEAMQRVRSRCGPDFPVIYRMSGIDLIPGSNSWDETYYFAQSVQEAGANALNIGIGWHESRIPTISMLVPRAYYGFVVQRIREQVNIPCICSNRINDPEVAEELMREGKSDFVSLARPLLADPDFARKAQVGDSHLINTCIACNQACLDNAFRNEATTCILNPEAGREKEMRLQSATHHKKVAVVGAGPAGLEASRTLALRGHRVTLFERNPQIGGQLLHAVLIPGKQEFFQTIRYYQSHLNQHAVRVELGTSVSASDLQEFDAVVIATGARPRTSDLPGASTNQCFTYEDFFRDPAAIRRDSAVAIVGAGGIGCDIAHYLCDGEDSYPPSEFFDDPNRVALYEDYLRTLPRKFSISLVRRGKRIGEKLGPTTRWALIQLLENRGVRMVTQIEYQEITADGLKALTRTGKELLIPADKIIFAIGQTPNSEFYEQIRTVVAECYLIGAAKKASETNAQSAIWEGAEIARLI